MSTAETGEIRGHRALQEHTARASRSGISHAEVDQATLLGLFHGYDQARIALARVVTRYGVEAPSSEETKRKIWDSARRAGFTDGLFHPPSELEGSLEGINEGAHSAALSAFATVSHQAEEILRELRVRWPDLRDDAGGPLPAPSATWGN